MRLLIRMFTAFVILIAFAGCGSSESTSTTSSIAPTTTAPTGPVVVVSNTWVGAIAKVAGATNVVVLTPASEKNPAAYKPTPEELSKLAQAQFVFYSANDPLGEQMKASAGSARVEVIEASYEPNALDKAIVTIGKAMNNEAAATAAATKLRADLKKVADDVRVRLGVSDTPFAVANESIAVWVTYPGWTLAKTYSPTATIADLQSLKPLKPTLVLENVSAPAAGAELAKETGAQRVDLSNYPGANLDIVALAKDNSARMAIATEHR